MAIGGSFNPSTFKNQTPFETWAQVQGIGLYWDTENTFAAGKQGVGRASFGAQAPIQGRQGVRARELSAPMRGYSPARAQPVNMFASARNISSGGRDYGSQAIDRNELQRLESTGASFAELARQRTEATPGGPAGQRVPSARQQRRQLRKAGVPMPPQSGQVPLPPPSMPEEPDTGFAPPGGVPGLPQPPQPQQDTRGLPAPVMPTPHANVGSNWREVQAQRISELELGQPGPVADPSVGSRSYLEQAERRRAERSASRATGPTIQTPPAPWSRRPSPLPPPPPDSRTFDRNTFPAPTVTPSLPAPTSIVGDQTARMAAEVTAPTIIPSPTMTTTGAPMETTGAKSMTKPLTSPLTKPLTKRTSGSGGAGGPQSSTGSGTTAKQPRRKR